MTKSVHVVSRIMESEVHSKVPEVVVNDMYDFLSHTENLTLYGYVNLRYKLYCFLYYAVRGIGYQKLETITRFPHSYCHQCFGCLHSKLYEWASTFKIKNSKSNCFTIRRSQPISGLYITCRAKIETITTDGNN